MAQERQFLCDGCNDVVSGIVRGSYYHRDHIMFKGQISLQQNDERAKKRIYTYLTHGNQLSNDPSKLAVGQELCFCVKSGMPCVEKWVDRRRNEIEFRKREFARSQPKTYSPPRNTFNDYDERDPKDFDPRPNRFL